MQSIKNYYYSYWQIERDILNRQPQQGWGAKVINRLAADLQKVFPEMKGFSLRNLKCMQAFAEAYPDEQLMQQLVALIAWIHDRKTEFSPEEIGIGNEVAKIRSEINAIQLKILI